jgi:ribonuclease HII
VAEASVEEIDRLNILQATLLAMRRAVGRLRPPAQYALIDGNQLPRLAIPARAIVGGDATEPAISAASILAKTHRDALMATFDALHPGYGFAEHAGYGTAEHVARLRRLGPCPLHRRSFAPVRALLGDGR